MTKNMLFRHKILLAATLVVITVFALFTLYNDYRQRTAISEDLEGYTHDICSLIASNIENWLNGRILLAKNLSDDIGEATSHNDIKRLLSDQIGRAHV